MPSTRKWLKSSNRSLLYMPYTQHHSIRIHYKVIGQNKPALVLLHGLGESWMDWLDAGYVKALASDYQLILLDMRGHGLSDKPHEIEAYTFEKRAADVIAVLDEIEVKQAVFVGFSQGGWVAYPLAALYPDRLLKCIIMGAHPQRFERPNLTPSPEDAQKLIQTFIETARTYPNHYTEQQLKRWADVDLAAIAAAMSGVKPSFMSYLAQMKLPTLMIVGEKDDRCLPMKIACAQLAAGEYVVIADVEHIGTLLHSDQVLPHVLRFLGS